MISENEVIGLIKEIRIHGRGGQGNVTAGEFLAEAAFTDGLFAQAFPMFGSERHGAPVTAYVRISDSPIRKRSQIYEPDYLIVQDPSLFRGEDILQGLKPEGLIVINSSLDPDYFDIPPNFRAITIPATEIAIEILGKPIINTIMIGAFAGASREIRLESLERAVLGRYPGELGKKEAEALKKAYYLAEVGK